MISIQIDDEQKSNLNEVLAQAAVAVLQQMNVQGDASIVLSDDDKLQELNIQFMGIDAPTDVLSFPSGEIDPDSGELYLGDVIISQTRASQQALAGGHSLEDELKLLVVHGMLHLLGYDHADADEKARMWVQQSRILENLGCKISFPSQ
jgi:probable rRNA maturation factor